MAQRYNNRPYFQKSFCSSPGSGCQLLLTVIIIDPRAGAAGTGDIVQAADELRRTGEVNRGYLGIITRDIRELELYQKSAMNIPLDVNTGLVVVEVMDGSPAQEAGLQANDIVQSADDVLLSAPDSLRKVLYSHQAGDSMSLNVIRGESSNAVQVVLK